MDDPLSIWGSDADAEVEPSKGGSTSPPLAPLASSDKPLALPLDSPPDQPLAAAPLPGTRDDDEPGWGLASSPPPPESNGVEGNAPPAPPILSMQPESPVSSMHPEPLAAPHPDPEVVETSTEGVDVEATMPYYEQPLSRPSSASASRRASGHSTPTGFSDKAGLKLSTMTAPPTPEEHLPGNLPNPLGPLAVFSPGISPTAPGTATRITGRTAGPSSAHPALLHQHLARLRQQVPDAENKGKARAVDPAPALSGSAPSEPGPLLTQPTPLAEPDKPREQGAQGPSDPDQTAHANAQDAVEDDELPTATPQGEENDVPIDDAQEDAKPSAHETQDVGIPDDVPPPSTQDVQDDGFPNDAGDDGFSDDDGFDDFGEPGEFTEGDADFGDFDDFEQVAPAPVPAPAPEPAQPPQPTAAPVAPTQPTFQVPTYSADQDAAQVASSLSRANVLPWLFSIPPPSGTESVDRIAVLGRDGIRQMGGTAQVLGTTGGANTFLERMKNPPDLPPVVWDRSRTRAQHRQSLGLPPETPRPQNRRTVSVQGTPTAQVSRDVSPAPHSKSSDPPLAPTESKESPNEPPTGSRLDRTATQAVLSHTQDSLQLLSLPVLRGLVDSAASLTGAASTELTHWLTVREGLAADAETYNTMIRDLVVGASARLGPGNSPPSSRSGSKKGPTMRWTMGAGIPRPQSPATRSSTGSGPASRSGTPLGSARAASGRATPSGSR